MRFFISLLLVGLLSGCVEKNSLSAYPLIPANKIVEKTVTIPPPSLAMTYHLTTGSNPALIKAYADYQKNGQAKTIETDQFIQFPYNFGSQPTIAANILELTVISLENGEQVSSVSSGDPLRWSYSLVYSGNGVSRQAHIMIKPAKSEISTDFFITTDRRAYLLKLVSTTDGKYVRDVRFWYPEKMQSDLQQQYNIEKQVQNANENIIAQLPVVDVSQLNFNYKLSVEGSRPVWMPKQVFDDGVHTYIQLMPNATAGDLPALFVQNGASSEIVNYRYKAPYFVVDKIFSKAILMTGTGHNQQRVSIIHY